MREDYAGMYRAYRATHPGHYLGALDVAQARVIARLVERCRPARLLDYGSGAGMQYLTHRRHVVWGGMLPYCYDPGVPGLDQMPSGVFEGVISTDVFEHISEDDLPEACDHLASLINQNAPSFIYLHVSCLPANETLPDGRNAHLTIRPPEWWEKFLKIWLQAGRNFHLETSYET